MPWASPAGEGLNSMFPSGNVVLKTIWRGMAGRACTGSSASTPSAITCRDGAAPGRPMPRQGAALTLRLFRSGALTESETGPEPCIRRHVRQCKGVPERVRRRGPTFTEDSHGTHAACPLPQPRLRRNPRNPNVLVSANFALRSGTTSTMVPAGESRPTVFVNEMPRAGEVRSALVRTWRSFPADQPCSLIAYWARCRGTHDRSSRERADGASSPCCSADQGRQAKHLLPPYSFAGIRRAPSWQRNTQIW